MVDANEGIQAKTKNPSLNRRLELLHISKTAHYYEKVVPFSSSEDIKLLNIIKASLLWSQTSCKTTCTIRV